MSCWCESCNNVAPGKTSLLDCLAGRKTTGTLTGDVLINGHPLHKQHFKYVSSYVMQDDVLLGALTAREYLRFTARLRLPHASPRDIEDRVAWALKDMALTHVGDTFVGNEHRRGLSGLIRHTYVFVKESRCCIIYYA